MSALFICFAMTDSGTPGDFDQDKLDCNAKMASTAGNKPYRLVVRKNGSSRDRTEPNTMGMHSKQSCVFVLNKQSSLAA